MIGINSDDFVIQQPMRKKRHNYTPKEVAMLKRHFVEGVPSNLSSKPFIPESGKTGKPNDHND
jgi:hypothetical protein